MIYYNRYRVTQVVAYLGVNSIDIKNLGTVFGPEEVESAKGEEFALKHGMVYMETSAIATKNVREAFLELLARSSSPADLASSAGAGGGSAPGNTAG